MAEETTATRAKYYYATLQKVWDKRLALEMFSGWMGCFASTQWILV